MAEKIIWHDDFIKENIGLFKKRSDFLLVYNSKFCCDKPIRYGTFNHHLLIMGLSKERQLIDWDDEFILSNDFESKTLKTAHDIYCNNHNAVSIYAFAYHCQKKLHINFLYSNKIYWHDDFIKENVKSFETVADLFVAYNLKFCCGKPIRYNAFYQHLTSLGLREKMDRLSIEEAVFIAKIYPSSTVEECIVAFNEKFHREISAKKIRAFARCYGLVKNKDTLKEIYSCSANKKFFGVVSSNKNCSIRAYGEEKSLSRIFYEIHNNCELNRDEIIVFKDGNTFNFAKDNLIKLSSRSASTTFCNMRRGCGYVPEVTDALVKIAELKSEIRKIEKEGEQ